LTYVAFVRNTLRKTATAKSPVEVYQSTPKHSRRGKSKTPLQDFLNSPAAKEQRRYSEIKKLEVELQTERDARLFFEEKFEEMKKEKDRMETKKDEDIKKLQAKLCERHVQIEDDFVKQTNTYSTDQHLKIIELREVIECLDEKCANLTDENCKLSEKVTSLKNQLSDWKLRSETFETNYLDAQQKIAAQVRECFLLEQELAEAKARTVVSNKVDNDTSVEWDYTDIIEDLCPNENLGSTVVDVLLQEKLQKISELEDKVESLESFLSQKEIELSERENNIALLSDKVQEYNVNIDEKLKEIEVLNNKIDLMKIDHKEQETIINDLRGELSNVQKKFADHKENVANILQESESDIILKEQIIKDLENGIEEKSNILDETKKLLHEQLEHASSLEKQVEDYVQVLGEKAQEISSLTDTVQLITAADSEKQNVIASLQEQLDSLQNAFNVQSLSLREELKAEKEKIRMEKENNTALLKEIADRNLQIDDQAKEIKSLSSNVNLMQQEISAKRNEILSLQEELSAIKQNHDQLSHSLKQEIEEKEVIISETGKEISKLQEYIKSKEEKLCRTENELSNASDLLHEMKMDNGEKQKKIELLQDEVSTLQEKCDCLTNENVSKDTMLQTIEERKCNLEKELESSKALLVEMEEEARKLQESIKCQEVENIEKQKTINTLQADLVAVRGECELLEKSVKERDTELSMCKTSFDLECSSLKDEVTAREEKLIELKERVLILEKEIETKKALLVEKDDMLAKKETIICEDKKEILELRGEIGAKSQNLAEKIEEINKLSETINTFQKDNLLNQSKILSLQNELETLQKSINLERESFRKEIEEKEAQLVDTESKVTFLKGEIILKDEELSSKVAVVSGLTDTVQRIRDDNSEMQRNINSLQEKLNSANKSYNAELESLQKLIADKESLLCQKLEKELTLEKEIAMKETMLMEKVEDIAKLSKKNESMHQDSIEKQDTILNLLEEQKLLQSTLTLENEDLKKNIAEKEERLCEKEREIEKQAENIDLLKKDLHNRKDEIIALLKKVAVLDEELTEKRIMVNNLSETKLTSERVICENEILRNEKAILETKLIETEESVKELNNKIQSLDEDLNQKQKAIDDLMKMQTEENDSIKKESEEHLKAAEVLKAKYTDLKLKFFEKAKECGNMKSIYEEKLARLKEQMQAAYNKEKEKILVQNNSATNELEKTLQMYKEKFMQHHGDNVDLRTQVWDLSEKLLRANDEKAKLQTRLSSLLNNQAKHSALGEVSKFALEQHPVDRRLSQYKQSSDRSQIDVMDVIDESVTYVRRRTRSCRKSIPPGIGQAFPPQDEEGEEFNAKYLADMKAGRCLVEQGEKGRLTEYQHRNSMVLPHLKSSYPVTDCKELLEATEDDVKFGTGGDLDNFDTLSTSLLLPDRKKNKDRGQGLEQGATPHSVLREQNDNSVSRKGTTPGRLRMLFAGKGTRRDENSPITPRTRGLGFFRKTGKSRNQPL
ncbi:Uncharacterized protein GBIM_07017, partial [Gryllus bimaculatus]